MTTDEYRFSILARGTTLMECPWGADGWVTLSTAASISLYPYAYDDNMLLVLVDPKRFDKWKNEQVRPS
jgi:hypothetical protein